MPVDSLGVKVNAMTVPQAQPMDSPQALGGGQSQLSIEDDSRWRKVLRRYRDFLSLVVRETGSNLRTIISYIPL